MCGIQIYGVKAFSDKKARDLLIRNLTRSKLEFFESMARVYEFLNPESISKQIAEDRGEAFSINELIKGVNKSNLNEVKNDFRTIDYMLDLVEQSGFPTYKEMKNKFSEVKALVEKEIYSTNPSRE